MKRGGLIFEEQKTNKEVEDILDFLKRSKQMTRCKFKCDSITDHGAGNKSVSMTPVVSGSDENKAFWKYTPSGKFEINYANQNVFFEAGKEYFVDISPA